QFGSGRLKPSILMSDSEVERIGGGGYGKKYWGISVSRSKRIASNFSTGISVRVYPIILVKNAKIKEMPELSDAADLEDYIEDLWEEGVDAVWIGDKNRGEQELCVINPAAIVNIDNPDIYKYYKLGTSENPINIIDKDGINKLYQDAKRYVNALENKPKKPEKPSRFLPAKDGETIGEMKSDEQYQKEMSEYERKLDEYNNSDEVRRFQQEDEYAYRNIRFFKTPSGHAYGFTVDGKIYVDKKIAGSETPIHEYSHLWAAAMRQVNPEEWKNIVNLMKGTTLWEEVKKMYPELTTDDDIADEVLAHYSGKRGAERLKKAQEEAMKQEGLMDKAAALSAIYRVKEALSRFWKGVADFLGVHFTSAEEVADKVLSDMLNGVNPAGVAKNSEVRYQFIGEKGLGLNYSSTEGNPPKVKDGFTLYVAKDGSKIVSRSLFRDEDFKQIEAASEDASKGRAVRRKTVFSPARIRLRKLKEGETCSVERRYVENGMFDFTGKEKIESDADVAYIFRQLENAAVENCFMVLLKDGRPTVIHISMGSYSSTMAPFEQAFVAYSALKPDKVYFVHNHPSGNLKASRQDRDMLDRMKKMFGSDVVNPGIIIDTTSGKYGVFDDINIEEDMPVRQEGEVPLKVYNFSKQVFSPGWNPMESFKIKGPDDVAAFVSSHRLGEHEKMSFLVLGNDNSVVANVFLPYTKLSDIEEQGELKSATDMMAGYVHQCGGT
ncbi:MAG: JAB domain-containing protein, partial [Segatella copri]